jgi:hypothetical protein
LGEAIGAVDEGEVDAELEKLLDEQAEESGEVADEADEADLTEDVDVEAYM